MCAAGAVTAALIAAAVGAGERGATVPEESARRAAEIGRDVAEIRALAFDAPVSVKPQSREDFLAYLEAQIAEQYGADGLNAYMRGLARVGALREQTDLRALLREMLSGQTAAYYDPKTRTYYLLTAEMPKSVLDGIAAHELCHALQDRHFDLRAFLEGDRAAMLANADMSQARQSLVEGEATLVMLTWMLRNQAGSGAADAAAAEAMATAAVASHAALGLDALLDLVEEGGFTEQRGWGRLGPALLDLKRYPRLLVEMLYSAYMQGALMVDQVKAAGGWEAVSRLYADPPQSTEQVLHPEKLRAPRDAPRLPALDDVAGALAGDWILVEEDVLGELGIRAMLRTWEDPELPDSGAAASAAAGWGGDRYALFERKAPEGELLVWRTVWDSARDASEFAAACRLMLARRFPFARTTARGTGAGGAAFQTWEVTPGRFLRLGRRGDAVSVLDTTEAALLDRL